MSFHAGSGLSRPTQVEFDVELLRPLRDIKCDIDVRYDGRVDAESLGGRCRACAGVGVAR